MGSTRVSRSSTTSSTYTLFVRPVTVLRRLLLGASTANALMRGSLCTTLPPCPVTSAMARAMSLLVVKSRHRPSTHKGLVAMGRNLTIFLELLPFVAKAPPLSKVAIRVIAARTHVIVLTRLMCVIASLPHIRCRKLKATWLMRPSLETCG